MNQSSPKQQRISSEQENLKRLSGGVVLLARDILQDPNFDSTLVLICIHSGEGSYGLVLNRPSHMPLSEIFDGFQGLNLKREVFIGGPVQQEQLQVLQITDTPAHEAFRVKERVFMGGKWENVSHMIETDPLTTHLFLGYSGWAAGQLEAEIKAGAWDVYRVDIENLLLNLEKMMAQGSEKLASYLESIEH